MQFNRCTHEFGLAKNQDREIDIQLVYVKKIISFAYGFLYR